MAAERLLILGASGHARVLIDIVEKQGVCDIIGLLDPRHAELPERMGYPVLGPDEMLAALVAEHGITCLLLAIGENRLRRRVAQYASKACPALGFHTAIHPDSSLARDVKLGEGTVVMAGARINSGCRVGRHAILNTNCSLDHESRLGDFASMGPNTASGGNCDIGEEAMIGIGANLLPGVTVGARTQVGGGATVTRDLPDDCVAVGTPARTVKRN